MPGIDVGTNFKRVKILKFSTQNLDFSDFGRLRSIWSAILPRILPCASAEPLVHRSSGGPGSLQILKVSTQGVIPLFREVESIKNEANTSV